MQKFAVSDIGEYISFGRNAESDGGLYLFWTGSGIEFNISAQNLNAEIDCMYDNLELMLDVILEGERTQKLVLRKGLNTYQIFSGMNPEKSIKVRIVRDTQCMADEKVSYLKIAGFETDGNFEKPSEYSYNIEFIGDSLTSGEGCGLTKREEWIPVVFDAVSSYTYMTAEKLGARYQVLSESGWGLYSSWDGNLKNVLPDYYEMICGTTGDGKCIGSGAHEAWDFSKEEMDAVVINLGTNDSNALRSGKFEKDEFIKAFKEKAIAFLTNVRKKNGSCFIVWAYGMLGDDMEEYIKDAVNTYKEISGDMRTEYLKLPDCGKELGVRYHPLPSAHEKTAQVLADFLQSLTAYLLR